MDDEFARTRTMQPEEEASVGGEIEMEEATFGNLSDLERIETKLNLLCAELQQVNKLLNSVAFRRCSTKKLNESDNDKGELRSRLSAAKKMEDKIVEVLQENNEADKRLNKKPLRKEVAALLEVNPNNEYFRKKFNKAVKDLLQNGQIGFYEKHQLFYLI